MKETIIIILFVASMMLCVFAVGYTIGKKSSTKEYKPELPVKTESSEPFPPYKSRTLSSSDSSLIFNSDVGKIRMIVTRYYDVEK